MKLFIYVLVLCICVIAEKSFVPEDDRSLVPRSRKKRYLVFPEGASVAISVCTQAQLVGPSFLTEAVAFGVVYDLPNSTSEFKQFLYPKFLQKKRNRRDVYSNIEAIIDSAGYNGRTCIFRALCEASQRYYNSPQNIIEKILSIVFKFPHKVDPSEPEEHHLYQKASKAGKENQHVRCEDIFPQCSFSLLDMALGDYSNFF